MRPSNPSGGRAPADPRRPLFRFPPLPFTPVLRAAVCAVLAGGCVDAGRGQPERGVLAELSRVLDAAPPAFGPRLSVVTRYQPCPRGRTITSALVPGGCAGPFVGTSALGRLARIASRAAREAHGGDAPEGEHALAVIDLLSGDGGKSLDRAISSLQSAARASGSPAPVLADLSAAYLIRAERAGAPRDLLAAVEAAEEALAREPGNPAALFNRALALQRFGLVETAAEAWGEYLAADPASPWAELARGYRRQAVEGMAPPPPTASAPLEAYTAYAAAEPQGARSLALCTVLGEWANAVLTGDARGAGERLARAGALARGVAVRPGRDRALEAMVRAIPRSDGAEGVRRLARAHRAFAEACALDEQMAFRAAAERYAAAARDAARSPELAKWAVLLEGSMLFHGGDAMRGEAIFRTMAARADTLREVGLAARARLLLAAVMLRGDRFEQALAQAGIAAREFARTGERENEGQALDAVSISHFYLRDTDQGYASAYRALDRLRPYRSSYRLHNLLAFTAQTVADDGFPRAAVRMQDEGVRVADRLGSAAFIAEARLLRARLLASAGAGPRAAADLAAVRPYLQRLSDPNSREWMESQRRIVEGTLSLRADPLRAAVRFDSAGGFFMRMSSPLVALPAVVSGAQARLAAGDTARGATALQAALAILEHRRDSIRMEPRRAAVFAEARRLVEQVAMLRLAAGDTAGAVAAIDRGRATLAPVGRSWPRTLPPEREAVLEYALVADTLLAWTVNGGRVRLARARIDTLQLGRTVARVLERMESAGGEGEVRGDLARLYEWLVRPVEAYLSPGKALVVVMDGDLAPVPFAALWNARTGHYLVEEHQLRFAASLAAAARPAATPGDAPRALFIADPAFDPARHPGFERLAAAAGEVARIAARYPGARVLAGTAATWASIQPELGRATVVHYAGHAVFDDERPERSFLLLADSPGDAGPLRAGVVSELDLSGVRLVVLAACRSIRTGRDRAAGYSGLAGAFLAAGAGGTVGTLWEVDDARTEPLMVAFHRAYRASGDGPGALRAAQLALLHSRDAALRSPSSWAAFRYAGY
ncbi:MAG TPA: CHAT domain-containing protein [Longimicrobium sp.]|nr:CHAT domain-containing protein [Longimicrobium sp.]